MVPVHQKPSGSLPPSCPTTLAFAREDGQHGLGECSRMGLAAVAVRKRKDGHKPAVTENELRQAREYVVALFIVGHRQMALGDESVGSRPVRTGLSEVRKAQP